MARSRSQGGWVHPRAGGARGKRSGNRDFRERNTGVFSAETHSGKGFWSRKEDVRVHRGQRGRRECRIAAANGEYHASILQMPFTGDSVKIRVPRMRFLIEP